MTTEILIKSGKFVALMSMIIGTLIFMMFLMFSGIALGLSGLFFIVVAGIINTVFFLLLTIRLLIDKEQKRKISKTIGLILLNIPITILFCWISILWINTLRITFVNETTTDLFNIEIVGCQNSQIDKLNKGESKTVWINIPHDCAVSINYKLKGIDKSEDVTGYVPNGNGYSMTFKIGTNQKSYDQDL